jgi:oxygen-independent coproporphyrinogen-3 oxidase
MNNPLGLYVHIPFCANICHYCDFAKTANFTEGHVSAYLTALQTQLKAWSIVIPSAKRFTSVFFGGGTPGILGQELEPLMELIARLSASDAEITIEANPANVTSETIRIWRSMGFNRLSIGVQSFEQVGLKALTRDHTPEQAKLALERASESFPKSNGDLIFGWPGQSMKSWQTDLQTMIDSGVNHVSLYALTLDGQTPMARAHRRGVLETLSDDEQALFYAAACERLSSAGFDHEEVSNWSRPDKSCDHNWLYWQAHDYIGIGAGAHGFVDDGSDVGLRYQYPADLRRFLKINVDTSHCQTLHDVMVQTGGQAEEDRDRKSWLLEYIGCGLRCRAGIDLGLLKQKGHLFVPTKIIAQALDEGILSRCGSRLILSEKEWFRETSWSLEVTRCFTDSIAVVSGVR